MARVRGRSKRGERCRASIPYGHWHTTTLVAGLSVKEIIAPMIITGAVNGDISNAYVEQVLAPVLRSGDVVIMDNLPPYSPDFKPIEKAFSQIKAWLKKCAARTKDQLDEAIAKAMERVSNQNAQNYFNACGYESDTV